MTTLENHTLQKANEALSKRQRAKKSRVYNEGALSVQSAKTIMAQKETKKQQGRDERENRGRNNERPATT